MKAYNYSINRLIFFLVSIGSFGCDDKKPAINKFDDPVLVKIADFQDKRSGDSLLRYFNSENARYRRDAILAFASIQDSNAVEAIGKALRQDQNIEVRKAAAYALGQTKCSASFKILDRALMHENAIVPEVAEALGKMAKDSLSFPLNKTPGSTWAYYRFGINNKTGNAEILSILDYLDQAVDTTALKGAVHFLARTNALNNASENVASLAEKKLWKIIDHPDVEVRMAAVYALRKIKTDSSLNRVIQKVIDDVDYRVRVNAVRSLQAFPFDKTKNTLFVALNDKQSNVYIAASEVIKQTIITSSWNDVILLAREHKNWRVQANLFEAVLSVTNNKEIAEEIQNIYAASANPYQKAALIVALQHSVMSFGFVANEMFKTDIPIIRTSAAEALVGINHNKNFDKNLTQRFADLYRQAIDAGDPAVVGITSMALADSTLGYRKVFQDLSFLYNARKKLSLPKNFEALQPLEAAIAYFENRPIQKLVNNYSRPINWELVKRIPKNQSATIKTSKGNIVITLFVEEAPGSVSNFVELVNKKYFDHKIFHRVVPNFVVQAGCNRGDGWGSEDYSLRSEFTERKYKTGSVGMASAGKDTEGTQWFITHSPTPHLDGRYTIFAEVLDGMEVVHQLEVGDEILEVVLN
jgi:cyclophilin family peptidyl-prolyl cis-trans isomerase/HEAT repeat protein